MKPTISYLTKDGDQFYCTASGPLREWCEAEMQRVVFSLFGPKDQFLFFADYRFGCTVFIPEYGYIMYRTPGYREFESEEACYTFLDVLGSGCGHAHHGLRACAPVPLILTGVLREMESLKPPQRVKTLLCSVLMRAGLVRILSYKPKTVRRNPAVLLSYMPVFRVTYTCEEGHILRGPYFHANPEHGSLARVPCISGSSGAGGRVVRRYGPSWVLHPQVGLRTVLHAGGRGGSVRDIRAGGIQVNTSGEVVCPRAYPSL